jgi:hypothetical protein
MERKGIIHLIVTALWASLAAAGQPDAIDPNQAWNPAAHLNADWTGVSVSARIDQDANVPQRFITVAASIAVTNADGLLGLNQKPTAILALDPKARQVCSIQPVPDRTYTRPKTSWVVKAGQRVPRLDPYAISVSIALDPNRACPILLSRLEWSMYALVAGIVANVDVRLQARNRWESLAPGLWVLVEKAKIAGAAYEYSLKLKYNPQQVRVVSTGATLTVGGVWKFPTAILSGVQVRNARGEAIEDQSNYGSLDTLRSDSTEATGTYTGKGTCAPGDTAGTIRFVLALNPYEKEARFAVTNVPIPVPLN